MKIIIFLIHNLHNKILLARLRLYFITHPQSLNYIFFSTHGATCVYSRQVFPRNAIIEIPTKTERIIYTWKRQIRQIRLTPTSAEALNIAHRARDKSKAAAEHAVQPAVYCNIN
ncbi:hypothetical protein PUN28_003391 [Cardiocondyla obscurior]|uniref:Uncharacterized protein n=1 Tax=Cardiocondyla obscurior TaxID=286306 RepID=A0AAW2GLZ9_9HYME